MSSGNEQFDQLLSSCKSRLESEEMEQKIGGRPDTLNAGVDNGQTQGFNTSKVVFSLKDFMEKSQREESVRLINDETTGINVGGPKEEDHVEAMMTDDDSDVELLKSEKLKTDEDINKAKVDSNSDLDDDIEKLDDIIDSLNSKCKEEIWSQPMEDSVIIEDVKNLSEKVVSSEPVLDEKSKVDPESKSHPLEDSVIIEDVKNTSEELAAKKPVLDEKVSEDILLQEKLKLGKFSGLSIKISNRSEREAVPPTRASSVPTANKDGITMTKVDISIKERSFQQTKENKGNLKDDSTLTESIPGEDSSSDCGDDDDSSKWDVCTHGDLIQDYMCYECTFNRWRVSLNEVQPKEKKKKRPEFLEIGHRLNIGNLRNVSIRKSTAKSPQKPGSFNKDSSKPSGFTKVPLRDPNPTNNAGASYPNIRIPPGLNVSAAGDSKKNFNFTKLPSGISFFKPSAKKDDSVPPSTEKSTKSPSKDTKDCSGDPSKSPTSSVDDPVNIMKNVDWMKVFELSGLTPNPKNVGAE